LKFKERLLKLIRKVKVRNILGLHARPATVIVKLLQGTRSSVFFSHREETVNARSIIGILMLAVNKNGQITITVEGDDAQEVMDKLIEAFDNHFWE
jgi:phosphocarrier protein HPr